VSAAWLGSWTACAFAQTTTEYHQRADLALRSFLLKFWSGSRNYLNSSYPDSGGTAGYWTFAQGFDALLDGVERTEGTRYAGLIETFYLAQDRRGWIVFHYDDESWMALALMRAYDMTGKTKYLDRAEALYQDIQTGWDTSCCGSLRGGIWWDKGHSQKATAANAGPVIGGVRLSERTGDASYLTFAEQVYDYWYGTMVNHSTGQVTDHVNPDGTKVYWKFTYNEGLMVGASLELYRATGDADYLSKAHQIATFLVTKEVVGPASGRILYDGTNTGCGGDCHAFKGIAYRYLMELSQETGHPEEYYSVLKTSVDSIWTRARTVDVDLFSVNWGGPPMSTFSQPQVTAAVMALNLFADDAGPFQDVGRPARRYEAEEATVFRIGIEAHHGEYSGWGYIAGWRGDDQWVDFTIHCPSEGPRDLIFRYAAGAGPASRSITVNAEMIRTDQPFPATDSWSAYETVTVRHTLPAGTSTVRVAYDAALGSSNFLNLDLLDVRMPPRPFVRGDANADGKMLDISDAVFLLQYLFAGGPEPPCMNAADANDDEARDMADGIFILQNLFAGGPAVPPPHPECGTDPTTGSLECKSYPPCP
jgi:predicted alpha-1,6-mannanase (GH76 family)